MGDYYTIGFYYIVDGFKRLNMEKKITLLGVITLSGNHYITGFYRGFKLSTMYSFFHSFIHSFRRK